jgi:ferric-dicitrate binding protein FerR (iron transport regulator)
MNSDLHTLALRYALGELAGAEALAFESRLEADQSAREALADAVILSSALRQLPAPVWSTAPVHQPAARRSRMAVMITCAAACLMIVVLMKLPQTDHPIAHRNAFEATDIVGTWSELGDDDPALSEVDSEVVRDDASSDIPDWMVAAVLEEDVEAAPRKEGTL